MFDPEIGAEELHLAPGPAAFSQNGNGADEEEMADIVPEGDRLEMVEYLALAALTIAGAAFALALMAYLRKAN